MHQQIWPPSAEQAAGSFGPRTSLSRLPGQGQGEAVPVPAAPAAAGASGVDGSLTRCPGQQQAEAPPAQAAVPTRAGTSGADGSLTGRPGQQQAEAPPAVPTQAAQPGPPAAQERPGGSAAPATSAQVGAPAAAVLPGGSAAAEPSAAAQQQQGTAAAQRAGAQPVSSTAQQQFGSTATAAPSGAAASGSPAARGRPGGSAADPAPTQPGPASGQERTAAAQPASVAAPKRAQEADIMLVAARPEAVPAGAANSPDHTSDAAAGRTPQEAQAQPGPSGAPLPTAPAAKQEAEAPSQGSESLLSSQKQAAGHSEEPQPVTAVVASPGRDTGPLGEAQAVPAEGRGTADSPSALTESFGRKEGGGGGDINHKQMAATTSAVKQAQSPFGGQSTQSAARALAGDKSLKPLGMTQEQQRAPPAAAALQARSGLSLPASSPQQRTGRPAEQRAEQSLPQKTSSPASLRRDSSQSGTSPQKTDRLERQQTTFNPLG